MSDEIAQLKKELAALKDRVDPPALGPRPAPFDYSRGMSMPAEALRDMCAVNTRGLAADLRRVAPPASQAEPSRAAPSNNGWLPETPLHDRPPGDRYVKALLDDADRRERGR
jgi:hypothetical protein